MRRHFFLMTVLFCLLAVAACKPDRKQTDLKLAAGCQDSIRALSEPVDQIDFKKSSFKSEKSHDGLLLRTVTLDAHFIHDHGMMVEKTYTCTYNEVSDLFGYKAEFYRLEKDGNKYGNYNGQALGELEDLLKINHSLEATLH